MIDNGATARAVDANLARSAFTMEGILGHQSGNKGHVSCEGLEEAPVCEDPGLEKQGDWCMLRRVVLVSLKSAVPAQLFTTAAFSSNDPRLQVIWLCLNSYLFIETFIWYENADSYYYTRILLGSALAWARASAMCLNFNCMLILIPVSRNFVSFIRGTSMCCNGNLRRLLDKNITFHRLIGYMIIFQSGIHVVAHMINIQRYHESYSLEAGGLCNMLSYISNHTNESYLNPLRSYDMNITKETLVTLAGITGFVISLALVLIITSSTEVIKRSFYEIFWYTHNLSTVFFTGLVIHGAGQIVRGQTMQSMQQHNISYCKDHFNEWGAMEHCPFPQFSGNKPMTWKWVILPLALHAAERVIRFWRSKQKVIITKIITHPCSVVEIQMKKAGFIMEPGQYIFLQCPSISQVEWHPFTLTSAPQEPFFSVHIRAVGDWTQRLIMECGANGNICLEPWQLPRLAVDGPHGSAMTSVFNYQVSVCIAAGIGVTPFASLLKAIWYNYRVLKTGMKLKKMYFYWLCRNTNAFEWFIDLLLSLEEKMSEQGISDFVTYHLFLTGWNDDQVSHIALHNDSTLDVITGLRHKTKYGRPDWHTEFKCVADNHPRNHIGVFYCGPKSLSKNLNSVCRLHSSSDPRGVHFHYNKESF
ncbi:NADPH oxidase 3 [Hyperolius riggenbachi]|uniref:NADPH oxidase 3 n=1 Tax=Hyperolius riggenbachi TaxID=752182 RepID=UPI0035A26E36